MQNSSLGPAFAIHGTPREKRAAPEAAPTATFHAAAATFEEWQYEKSPGSLQHRLWSQGSRPCLRGLTGTVTCLPALQPVVGLLHWHSKHNHPLGRRISKAGLA